MIHNMGVKVSYEKGPNMQESFYVGSDGTKDPQGQPRMVVVRATYILNPAFVSAVEQIRASETTPEQKEEALKAMPVQPEHIAEQLEKSCSTLEEFDAVCKELALRNSASLGVQAQTGNTGGTKPTYATEPQSTIKVGEEPRVAAEAGMTGGKVPTEGAGDVRKFFGRLPSKSVGEPQRSLDLHSSQLDPIVAAELQRLTAELEQLKTEKAQRDKDDGLKGIMGVLTELGALEDAKDREAFTKDLGAIDEKALGVLEKILKKVRDAKAGKPPAAPKAPGGMPGMPSGMKPPAPKAPGGGGMPALSSMGNLAAPSDPSKGALPITAGALAGVDQAAVLQAIFFAEDAKKVNGRNSG